MSGYFYSVPSNTAKSPTQPILRIRTWSKFELLRKANFFLRVVTVSSASMAAYDMPIPRLA